MALVTPSFCLAKHNLAHPFQAVFGFDQSMKHDRAPIQVELDPGRVGPPLLCTLSELRVKWLRAGQQSFGMVGWSITVGPPLSPTFLKCCSGAAIDRDTDFEKQEPMNDSLSFLALHLSLTRAARI